MSSTALRHLLNAGRPAGMPVLLVFLAFVLVVFEGAIRKWLIGSEAGHWSYLAYFSKDIAFGAILFWPGSRTNSPALDIFRNWFVIGATLFAAGALLSSLRGLNAVGALLTLRAGLLLPMVALLAARRLPGIRLEGIAILLILCALLNCGLGVAQNRLSPGHVLNRYVAVDSVVSAVETAVRATGTFSYITGLGVLSSVAVWAGMALFALAQTGRAQMLALVGIIAGFGCGLASVSRGPILVGCLMLLAWVGLSRAGLAAISKSAALWILLLLLLCGAGLQSHFTGLARAVRDRHETGEDTFAQRAFGQLIEGGVVAAAAPFGTGLGTEQIGGNYAVNGTMRFTNFETQLPRLIAETGILGGIGYLVICAGTLMALQAARRTARTVGMDGALFAAQLLLIPIFYGNLLFNHTASAFAWLIVAVCLAVSLEDEEESHPAISEPSVAEFGGD